MQQNEVNALLGQPEGQHLAFVRAKFKPDELAQILVAFANAQGGTVVIGAARGRKPEGLSDTTAAREAALDAALACTPALVLPLPQTLLCGDAVLMLLHVPAGLSHVYSLHGKYLRRQGAADEPIPPDALRRLLLERGDTSWERLVPDGAQLDDLDTLKIAAYSRRVGTIAEGDQLGFLFRRGCLVRNGEWRIEHEEQGLLTGGMSAHTEPSIHNSQFTPTSAGVLLFGRDVERFFPQCEITLVRYRGLEMSDEFLREDIRDTLPEAVRRAEIWLSEHMRRGSRMVGLEREDWTQFPIGAVRETLVNAVAHRDYSVRGEGIRLALFADRLECYSPGRLPGHVTLQNLVDERFSRNETLVQVLSDFGLIERLGYGIDRMLRQMATAGLPPPEFRETAAGFLVTLRGLIGDGRQAADAIDTSEWSRMGLNERQIAALLFLAEQRRISNRDLQEMFADVSGESIRRDLSDLVDRGMLLRVGEKRGTYYILK